MPGHDDLTGHCFHGADLGSRPHRIAHYASGHWIVCTAGAAMDGATP